MKIFTKVLVLVLVASLALPVYAGRRNQTRTEKWVDYSDDLEDVMENVPKIVGLAGLAIKLLRGGAWKGEQNTRDCGGGSQFINQRGRGGSTAITGECSYQSRGPYTRNINPWD